MRFIIILFAIICFSFTKLYAQKVSLKLVNAPLDTLEKAIKSQTNCSFIYTREHSKKTNPITITVKDAPLNEVLEKIFANQPIDYTIDGKFIVFKDKDVSTEAVIREDYFMTGRVTDNKGATLPGATVFLANTKKATATDTTGTFRLNELSAGTYEVVVKMLGFEVYDQQVIIQKNSPDLHIQLKEANIVLNTVSITAMSSKLRGAFLQLFIEFFIGQSADAKKCKILNPGVINFSLDSKSGIMEGSSDQFIIIENQTLGYKIHYLLKDLKVNLGRHLMYYTGSSYFEELEGTASQQKKWEKNRELTYQGSIRHFFLAAFNHTLKEDGFLVYRFPDAASFTGLKKFDQKYYSPLNDPYALFSNVDKNIKQFNLGELKKDSTVLYVVYTKKDEPYAFTSSGRNIRPPFKISGSSQVSVIYPLLDSMFVDRNGNIDPKNSISYGGYWSWKMAAGFLPPDYSPPVIVPSKSKHPVAPVLAAGAKTIIQAIDTLRDRQPVEKLYLQTDKPYYLLNDTLHFKAYLLRGDFLVPLTRSGLLYVELDDEAGRSVKRIMVPVVSGVSNGDIALDERELPEGSYTLRAYTNWMRNFGEDYIFKKDIYISALSGTTLVKANFTLDSLAGKNKVRASLSFASTEKEPIRVKDMQIKVMNGKRALFSDKVTTGIDGSLNVNFNLADKSTIDNLYILANQTGRGADTAHLVIPVTINRPENLDVQFMPEGGSLVAGIVTKVGFKAIGEDGRGVEVSGRIINGKNKTITSIQTLHKGMGSFELTPEADESYVAVINLPNKTTKNYLLPKVNTTGTALRITQKGYDSLQVTLSIDPEALNTKLLVPRDPELPNPDLKSYYLIGQSRGIVCYAAQVIFRENEVKKTISTRLFPSGITRFTLIGTDETPLNERIVYIDHDDNLNITVNTNKPVYNTRDSVALGIQVKDKDGNPLQGTFLLAVTDDSQVKQDTSGSNIINDLLFTSDLKGTVEEPGWYFDPDSPDSYRNRDNKAIALDNLLLTQGWVGYDWKQVFNPVTQPKYPAETEFAVQGKVTNMFNNPIKGTDMVLLQKQPAMTMSTVTDDKGRFVFKGRNLFPPDTTYYLIEANKNFNIRITADEFIPPVFPAAAKQIQPWYVNSDTTLLNNGNTKVAQLKAEADYEEGGLLNTVNIKDKKIIPGSHNRNAAGGADITLDEKEMNAAKKMTLYELLMYKFKNFYKQNNSGHPSYYLNNRLVALVIDGVPIQGAQMVGEYEVPIPVDLYMDYLTAEDIKAIEIMIQPEFAKAYKHNIASALTKQGDKSVPLYIEITTYSGHGAYLKQTPGRYVYKPIGFTLHKQFYRPRYTLNNSNIAPGTDLRSIIHWEPNVITDKDGKATVSFFSADKPANYTLIMEGTDMNGNLGYKRQQLKVVTSTTAK